MTTSPLLSRGPFVTDGGLETDLIFHRGLDLPDFASFPLLDDDGGRALLRDYYRAYADVARGPAPACSSRRRPGGPTPTGRARLGYDADALARVNRDAVEHLGALAEDVPRPRRRVAGGGGGAARRRLPRRRDARRRPHADYHRAQLARLRGGRGGPRHGVHPDHRRRGDRDRARRPDGGPAGRGLLHRRDRRPAAGRHPLGDAVERGRRRGRPGLAPRQLRPPRPTSPPPRRTPRGSRRIAGVRPNASTLSHAELDEAEELDEGDLGLAHHRWTPLRPQLPVAGDRRRVLRHRRAPRRGDVGRVARQRRREIGGEGDG